VTRFFKYWKTSVKEGFSYEQEALELIAEVSDGAVRDALNLLEQISVVDEAR